MKYFEALGLAPSLALDPADLERRFYARSREWHPDRFVRASKEERDRALEASSTLNDAYRTLRDPVARAEYAATAAGLDSKALPPGFLEDMFELNMELEEGGDAAPLRERLTQLDAELASAGAAWDGSPDSPALGKVREILNRRRYIENLVHEHLSD
jgi:molecular chaperone HscB